MRGCEFNGSRDVATPGVNEARETTAAESTIEAGGAVPAGFMDGVLWDQDPMTDREQIRLYRSQVAGCNYLSVGRPEMAFATKELCRSMARPMKPDLARITRMCRFLRGLPRLVQRIPFAEEPPTLVKAYVDCDWAGCRLSRESTSGGILTLGGAMMRCWSTNQAVIALSSGEAEYYAALKGASLALGSNLCCWTLG